MSPTQVNNRQAVAEVVESKASPAPAPSAASDGPAPAEAGIVAVVAKVSWSSTALFFALILAFSAGIAWRLLETPAWRQWLVPILFPALCAAAAFRWWQQWKLHTREAEHKVKAWQDALDSVGDDAANAVNAIRASLLRFRRANPEANYPAHLDVIENGAKRIDAVLQRAGDPVAWYVRKKTKKKEDTPSEIGKDTRSRISL